MKAPSAADSLSTLVELYAGNRCPHENTCLCRTGSWCPKGGQASEDHADYPMLHLAGCAMGYEHCCCRVLDEIESLTRQHLDQAGVIGPPVPMDLVYLCDPVHTIEFRMIPLKAYFGCAWFLGNEWVVHLNSNNPVEVNRFTAFHEGFHILCSSSSISFSKVNDHYKPLGERLADYYAASLIMPRPFVEELWPQVEDVSQLARIFGAPEPMMQHWLVRLGLVPRPETAPRA